MAIGSVEVPQEAFLTAKKILLGLFILVTILLLVVLVKNFFTNRNIAHLKQEQSALQQNRMAADELVKRLGDLQNLEGELVHPQVELNIKF